MANVKKIKRRRTKRISIDDLFYQEQKRNLLKEKQEAKDRQKLRPDVLFDGNDYLYAEVRIGNTLGTIYRNGLDTRGRYCVYLKNKKDDYVVSWPNNITILRYGN